MGMSNDSLRWFGIVRKKNNKFVFTSALVKDYPEQHEFLRKILQVEKGDNVVELLQSSTWQPKDFVHYCNHHYVNAPPKREQEVTAPISQYKK